MDDLKKNWKGYVSILIIIALIFMSGMVVGMDLVT